VLTAQGTKPEQPKKTTPAADSTSKNSKPNKSDSKSTKGTDKASGDARKKKCFFCQSGDHWGNNCEVALQAARQYQASQSGGNQQSVNVAAALPAPSASPPPPPTAYTFMVARVGAAYNVAAPSDPNAVLLDNQATVSIFKSSRLLTNIRAADPQDIVTVKGINGQAELIIDRVGDTADFGTVYYCPQASANVLSAGAVEEREDVADILYSRGESYTVVFDTGVSYQFDKHRFNPDGGALYSCIFHPHHPSESALVTTVADNEAKYTSAEVKRARAARDVIQRAGFPSMSQMLTMIRAGALVNLPITAADLKLCNDIYGPDVSSLKGKGKQRKSKLIRDESLPFAVVQRQTLHADLMFVDREPYLVTVSTPMHLVMVTHLGGTRSGEALAKTVKEHLNGYTSRGFVPHMLFSDNEGGIRVIVSDLNQAGVAVNMATPGQHVPVVENAIRLIKERVRCVVASLPFNLPKVFMKWLIGFAVSRINMGISRTSGDMTSPREKFLGRKTNYARDMSIGFMQSAEVPIISSAQSSSVHVERTATAVALHPTGNIQGSVFFYLLGSGQVVIRERWTEVPMSQGIIDSLQSMESPQINTGEVEPVITIGPEERDVTEGEVNDEDALPPEFTEPVPTVIHPVTPDDPDCEDPKSDDELLIDLIRPPGTHDSSDESPDSILDCWDVDPQPAITRAEDLHSSKLDHLPEGGPVEEVYNISVSKGLASHGLGAMNAIFAEMGQMLEKQVWSPVDPRSLSPEQMRSVIRSSFFLKEKFDPEGKFIKLKGRLVAGGDGQDHSIYQESDISSPTCSLGALMMVAAIAAKERRHVCSIDIGGAYLNADMKADVFMRLDPKLASVLKMLDPTCGTFTEPRGSLIVKLKKALYGCIESGKLWFDKLCEILTSMGFVQNPYERCVWNMDSGGTQVTIVVYVDDLLLTSTSLELLTAVEDTELPSRLPEVKVKRGRVHPFLSMTLDFSVAGKVSITMPNYIAETLEEFGVTGIAATPALPQLFEVRESPPLTAPVAKDFHRFVAKLLYLPKRCRPDISVAVAFLSTRVQCCTEDDWSKLERVMKYLNGTRNLGICIQPDEGPLNPVAYVDASYGVHADGKSHTGCVISLGKGPVYVKSGKQKIVSKSSTEAELVGLSDSMGQIIWSREFLIAQGYKLDAVTVYQDNLSTMALARNGQSNSERTRHINLRHFFVTDRIRAGEIGIAHLGTEEMIADIMTKPLQGSLFRTLRSQLMNWTYDPTPAQDGP
jgi:hypothetical protein